MTTSPRQKVGKLTVVFSPEMRCIGVLKKGMVTEENVHSIDCGEDDNPQEKLAEAVEWAENNQHLG